jgi:hypothetical protein
MFNQAKDGGIHADPQRQSQYLHDCETWTPQQLARSEPNVAYHQRLDMLVPDSSREFSTSVTGCGREHQFYHLDPRGQTSVRSGICSTFVWTHEDPITPQFFSQVRRNSRHARCPNAREDEILIGQSGTENSTAVGELMTRATTRPGIRQPENSRQDLQILCPEISRAPVIFKRSQEFRCRLTIGGCKPH